MSQFGTDITSDDIVDTLSFFDSWEDRYKYIIDLGRELPELEADQRTEDNLVRGCQSQVWLVSRREGDRLYFDADSDAFIVKGLLAVVLAAYNGKRAEDIRDFDIEGYFSSLNLLKHLSVTRGNGLRAMVQRIQASAAA
ncbi:Fe-S cluster assembly protein SufE [Pseudomonas abyssi]|jgi:cysteine desulfuration protein SufE|uniref:Fe-S cluster assembly protein SufE n=1 Tax=Pseudomonas abyssi TaxID=170540 RepID=A0A2A3ME41_9PSED|nr:SufE family protein [Pseudomonas abyssi]MAD01630.1 Fe-S cluster assembly protein SufE [Pseudomonadales bacterium]PBK03032.1 Fe-S cluster assembly protein SufE [Pseudomonas abyssi]|tara:strand:+ start:19723 stop:20139 length:417 start_codon:yes stop_codon:yes gene_type:complete